jgi:hypothetical protein
VPSIILVDHSHIDTHRAGLAIIVVNAVSIDILCSEITNDTIIPSLKVIEDVLQIFAVSDTRKTGDYSWSV